MNVDSKTMSETKKTLLKFGDKYLTESGQIKTFNLVNDLDNFNKDLMTALFQNETIYSSYVEKINNTDVFKINKFTEMFQYKKFWEDSYTKYSNRIGLTSDNKFISDSSDVVLDFPFKDCVLEAGMRKEDKKKPKKDELDNDEAFLNETIAKAEIDELLEPKIFKNVKRYNSDGFKKINTISEDDNLIIKGNNLISLYSIKKKYSGKIKLIYLDPPFNTGNDSFMYNDKFSQSAWLTFMKNRIEISRELLKDDGFIFIECDYNEDSHLRLLMNDIFGQENYLSTITVRSNSISGPKTRNKNTSILKNKDSIVVFAKRKNKITLNPQYSEKTTWDTHYDRILINNEIVSLKKALINEGVISSKDKIKPNILSNEKFQKFIWNNKDKVFRTVNSISDELKELSLSKEDEIVSITQSDGKKIYALNGKRLSFLSNVYHKVNGEMVLGQLLGDLWTDIDFQNTQNQGGVKFTNAKKPEQLLLRIIDMTTKPGDIVMDFFMGSATTQAVALKTGRQFIGCEQMDYINTVSVPRLKEVISGEQGGISKIVSWEGGGSFVYSELMEKNYKYINMLNDSKSTDDLNQVYASMKDIYDINFKVDLEEFDKSKDSLDFDEQKKRLIEILDKNQLYYNYSNIEDDDVKSQISESDYEFNHNFYK